MVLTLKRLFLVVSLVGALLVTALLGGLARNAQTLVPDHASGKSSTQQVAWYCPAPPVVC